MKNLKSNSTLSFPAQIPVRVSSASESNPVPHGPGFPTASPSTVQPYLPSCGRTSQEAYVFLHFEPSYILFPLPAHLGLCLSDFCVSFLRETFSDPTSIPYGVGWACSPSLCHDSGTSFHCGSPCLPLHGAGIPDPGVRPYRRLQCEPGSGFLSAG